MVFHTKRRVEGDHPIPFAIMTSDTNHDLFLLVLSHIQDGSLPA